MGSSESGRHLFQRCPDELSEIFLECVFADRAAAIDETLQVGARQARKGNAALDRVILSVIAKRFEHKPETSSIRAGMVATGGGW